MEIPILSVVVLLIGLLSAVSGRPGTFDGPKARTCGYEACPQPIPGMLNVHIVPHSHDDVGWLKTVDQYYYGSRTNIQRAGVQYILDTVIQELLLDPTRRYVQVESAFMFQWWREQSNTTQEQVRQLVNEGRLEFIGGAWSMNDEANIHYQSTIDHFTWGLKRLNDTFGECSVPRVGWQIDPFGHSREMASLLAQMGYDGVFFSRLDHNDRNNRLINRKAEMIWQASDSLGEKSDLFTGVLYWHYSPPPGFCFDLLCQDEPFIDDPTSPDYNVDAKLNSFFDFVRNMALLYRSNNTILTMGDDFHYQSARMWYTNLDKLILYGNQRQAEGSNINIFYSSPSCYLKAVHEATNVPSFPTKSDDFFPYGSDQQSFWTGYFTSRPNSKRFERFGNNFLQVCKQLSAEAPTQLDSFEPNLSLLREAIGIMQHHDAITGTEKQHVADDYHRLLRLALDKCEENTQNVLNQLSTGQVQGPQNYTFEYQTCHDFNISSCIISERNDQFMVTLYNPTGHSTFQNVRIPITFGYYTVQDSLGNNIPFQVVPISEAILGIHYRHGNATHELTFVATQIPPLGYSSYYITKTLDQSNKKSLAKPIRNRIEPVTIGNDQISLSFNAEGQIESIHSNGVTSRLEQVFFYYEGADSDGRSSGAYIFRPRPDSEEQVISNAPLAIEVIRGDHVDEVHQIFNSWLSQVVRIYKNENHAEFDWLVGGIPIDDDIGKEVVTRFITDIQSNGRFETDSNGREIIERIRNYRPTWNLDLEEEISGNYYPVTSKIAIEDEHLRLAVMNDRAQGGSSIIDGTVEIMIHRRLLRDDGFGVGEALNETAFGSEGIIVRGTHYLTFGPKNLTSPTMEAQERFIQLKKLLPSWVFLSTVSNFTFEQWQTFNNHHEPLSLTLPQNVHLLTFEPWRLNSTALVRFEHILEVNEDITFSQNATFSIRNLFASNEIVSIRETTLAGNQWIDEATRLQWVKEDEDGNIIESVNSGKKTVRMGESTPKDLDLITLQPMEIRTFVIEFLL